VSYERRVYSLVAFSQIVREYAAEGFLQVSAEASRKRCLAKEDLWERSNASVAEGWVVNGTITRVEGDGWKVVLELYKARADDPRVERNAASEQRRDDSRVCRE
jgi:hypothetical protein